MSQKPGGKKRKSRKSEPEGGTQKDSPKKDQKLVQREVIRLKNGKYVAAVKKHTRTIYIQLISPQYAGIFMSKFYDHDLSTMLKNMNGMMFNKIILTVRHDQTKNMFVVPKDSIYFFYEKLEPYCRQKKYNLINVPEFVFKIVEHPEYKEKASKSQAEPPKRTLNAKPGSQCSDVEEEPDTNNQPGFSPLSKMPRQMISKLFQF